MRTVQPKDAHPIPSQAERVFKGIIYDVYHWQQKMFDGSMATFEMLKRPDTIEVIAVKDGNIIAIIDEQPTYKPNLKLPGGRHDIATETELDCAKRELHEETGMRFNNWKLISAEQLHPKIDQVLYIFLATGFAGQDEPHVDGGGEKITVRPMPFAEAKKLADAGTERYWPNQILRNTKTLDDLLALPDFTSS